MSTPVHVIASGTAVQYYRFRTGTWIFGSVVVIAIGIGTSEPLLFPACVLSLPLGAVLLWRHGEPPTLFAVYFLQWLQIVSGVFRTVLQNIPIAESYRIPGVTTSTWLSLSGLLILALGMRWALRGAGHARFAIMESEIYTYSIRKMWIGYLVSLVLVSAVNLVLWQVPGISQVLLALTGFKWAFYFALAVAVLMKQRGHVFLYAATAIELVLGFTSFFSEFRLVFFVLGLAVFTATPRVQPTTIRKVLAIFGAVVLLSAVWSLIKMDYRDFLSEGTGQQVVRVGPLDRVAKVIGLVNDVDADDLPGGFERLVDRVQYTEYFGRVVDWVPNSAPHSNGELWTAAVWHVLMPRLFFPDKPMLTPDVLLTQQFTGLNIIEQQGRDTEIPLGYMAESYVDFGPIGMFVPILLIGLMLGFQYRYFITRPRYVLFAYGAIAVVLRVATQYEISAVKLLGGSITAFVAMYLAFRFIVPAVHRRISHGTRRIIARQPA